MVDGLTIFSNAIWFQVIFPFLLVFTLVFAILEKSKVLGDGKRQINALVSLSVGLIVVLFGYAVYIINNLIAFFAVALVVIVVFMILVGALFEPGKGDFLHKNVKWAFIGIIFIALTGATLYYTGAWDYLYERLIGPSSSGVLFGNIMFIVIIIVAIVAVLFDNKGAQSSGSSP